MQQRCHEEVGDLCHAVAVLVAEHVAHRLALLVEPRVIAAFLPHASIFLVLLNIIRRLVHVELLVVEVVGLHADLHGGLPLLDEGLPYFIELPLRQFQHRAVVVTVDRDDGILGVGGQFDTP